MTTKDELSSAALNYDDFCGETVRDILLQILQNNDWRDLLSTAKAAVVDRYDCCDNLVRAFIRAGDLNHIDLLQAFKNHGMNVDAEDEYGYCALMNGSRSGSLEAVRWLLEQGATVDIQNSNGFTALMMASMSNRMEIVELLLEKNSNPDIVTTRGETALMHASANGHKEVVHLLLNRGCDKEVRDKNGKTALDMAENEELQELLRNHMCSHYVLK